MSNTHKQYSEEVDQDNGEKVKVQNLDHTKETGLSRKRNFKLEYQMFSDVIQKALKSVEMHTMHTKQESKVTEQNTSFNENKRTDSNMVTCPRKINATGTLITTRMQPKLFKKKKNYTSKYKPEVRYQNPLHISSSSVLTKNENVGSENSSPKLSLKVISKSGVQLPGMESFKIYLNFKLKKETLLLFLKIEKKEPIYKVNRCIKLLKVMKFIRNWLDQIEDRNKYITQRFVGLIDIMLTLKKKLEVLDEKVNFLRMEINNRIKNRTECEKYLYQLLLKRGMNIVSIVSIYMKYLDAKCLQYRRDRMLYIDSSIQATRYPFEEKLFEKNENFINQINNVSMLLNKTASKLVESSAFVCFFCVGCIKKVNIYFEVIEIVSKKNGEWSIQKKPKTMILREPSLYN